MKKKKEVAKLSLKKLKLGNLSKGHQRLAAGGGGTITRILSSCGLACDLDPA
ncbi:hypothetical protein [Taibaiella helva]|uniref:hypothetical protein n=1 Tax=Taibaiella helva TaxID=2301235 RepID=UPI001300B271|nr:hypothetical protein [Taibaiella helva]